MLRHRLAVLFEPRSLLVVSDRPLPIEQNLPEFLKSSTTLVAVEAGVPIVVAARGEANAPAARIDLALVCVEPSRLPEALEAIRAVHPRGLILLPQETPSANPIEDMAYCRAWARLCGCMVLGPRSFGVQRPHLGLNLSHQAKTALVGKAALVAQSRSITAAVLDWAEDVSLGFSTVVSLGDESVVDVAQVLEYLAMDPRTDSIALYMEDIPAARAFTSALRAAAAIKPVIVLKAGHDSSELGPMHDAVLDALLRRAGAVRISYFVQLFSALKVLGYARRPRGRRIALLSNGNGAPQLALDVMGPSTAVFRADLSLASLKALKGVLEEGADIQNPVITHAPLTAGKIKQAIDVLASDSGVDGVLVLLAPDPLTDMPAVARQLAAAAPGARKPVITCLMGDASMRPLRHMLDDVGTPAFRTPETAAHAFGILASYHYNQTLSQQTLPPEALGKPPRLDEARAILRSVRDEHRLALTVAECQRLFDCFHIPIQCAPQAKPGPGTPADDAIPMAIRVQRDVRLGPYIKFGSGGHDALVSGQDRAVELPPLNGYLARQLIERSALWRRVLSRQMSPAAFEHLQESLERISDLVSLLGDIDTLIVDSLFADAMQLAAQSVCIRLTASPALLLPETSGYRHMAIHPYPVRLVQARRFKSGEPWMMRPIRPEDAEPLQTFVRDLSDESRYMRFVSMLRELTPRMLSRYTRIDYDRELALVATVQLANPEHRGHPREHIIGFAHYLRNADARGAEYALVIGDDWQRRGLGATLMRGLIEAAQEQGLTYIDGLVLASNYAMLSLMTHLGFRNDSDAEDPTMRRVWLDLGESRTQ
ncbi:GNAT family N-acetyltransferase [Paralcaligenes sp. KSB-10]|uniref:bifunctional acetate--CoA ligase family protein/GNAT family N-acetyltransferase n=1 Tax=Paralcaligenes sp. KSB-10 TaxID=2901142 RepID=UPI001E6067F3|nr:GNAT family N-acetyltransferase [Paralcaligenes sp. KSB-10]UHL62773.1 GNAT family N-acetyltransferase [Paralcaligenes sp. KSB-10]